MDFLVIIEALKKEVTVLKEQLALLVQENERLHQAFIVLEQENKALKEQLTLNSTNSSLPPSRDIYRLQRKNRPKSDRKPGGQPGHKPQGYSLKTPDEIIDVFPGPCECGLSLDLRGSYRAEQKIDIPEIKPFIKEYRLHEGVCSVCRKKKRAPLPSDVQPDLLGPHAKAIISSLSGFFHNSKREVQQILRDLFHLDVSLGLVSATERRTSQKMGSYYEGLKEKLSESPYLHIDETGHRSKGKRGWAWIFTDPQMSFLKLTGSRGQKVLASVLPDYQGQVVSDRYGAYYYFEAEKRQICWAHLKRDFQRFAHSQDPSLAHLGKHLSLMTQEVFSLYRALKGEKINRLLFNRRIRKVQKRMLHDLKRILEVPGTPQAHRVARNLLKSFEMMWRFCESPDLEPTHNLAERQIRKYVIYRKKSFFTWSQRGEEFIERILSLFLSCRLQNQSAFTKLRTFIADG